MVYLGKKVPKYVAEPLRTTPFHYKTKIDVKMYIIPTNLSEEFNNDLLNSVMELANTLINNKLN